MRNAVRYDLNCKPLSVADRFFPTLAVTHDPRQLQGFGYPTPVVFPLEIDRQIHILDDTPTPG